MTMNDGRSGDIEATDKGQSVEIGGIHGKLGVVDVVAYVGVVVVVVSVFCFRGKRGRTVSNRFDAAPI